MEEVTSLRLPQRLIVQVLLSISPLRLVLNSQQAWLKLIVHLLEAPVAHRGVDIAAVLEVRPRQLD